MKHLKKFILYLKSLKTEASSLIIGFFIIRCIGITNPPLEILHSWRQCTGLMIARNFLTIDNNILYSRVDDMCGSSNIIASEFQLMSYIHYLLSYFLGFQHWYGRLITLIVSSIGIYCFQFFIKKYFDKKVAYYATLSLLVSCWFIYSRKFMPDTFSVSFVFIGFYWLMKYMDENKAYYLILYFVFITLGCLVKIPAIIYLSLLPILLFNSTTKNKLIIGISTLISIGIVYIWYFIWGMYLSKKYGNWMNLGKPIWEGVSDIIHHLPDTFYNIIFHSFYGYIYFGLFILGLFYLYKSNNNKTKLSVLILSFVFFLYILKSGYFFYHHSYYMIPFVPVMALVIGLMVANIKNKYILILVIAASCESLLNQYHDLFTRQDQKYKLELEAILNKVSYRNDKILINAEQNPQQIYLSNRKGCHWKRGDGTNLSEYKQNGCKVFVIDKHNYYITPNLPLLYQDRNYLVYKL